MYLGGRWRGQCGEQFFLLLFLKVLLVPLLLDVLMSKRNGVNQSIAQFAGILCCRAVSWSPFQPVDAVSLEPFLSLLEAQQLLG